MSEAIPEEVLWRLERLRAELGLNEDNEEIPQYENMPEPIEIIRMLGGGVLVIWYDGSEMLYGRREK